MSTFLRNTPLVGRITFLFGCVLLFAAVWFLLLPSRLQVPSEETFSSDAAEYHAGAVSLTQHGLYSLDGQTPAIEREPGYSAFLAIVYLLFGIGNRLAIFVLQGILYLVAASVFTREWARHGSARVANLCFLFLLVLPSVYHAIFTVNREILALSLMLLFAAFFLRILRRSVWSDSWVAGLLLGAVILTYIPFLFFPIALIPLCLLIRVPKKYLVALVIVPLAIVSLWGVRNDLQTGTFQLTGGIRTTYFWYVRGERAETLRGSEPYRCLWAEYISRDWDGRSSNCSYNGVIHRRFARGQDVSDLEAITRGGQQKIVRFFPFYLWDSVSEILELHLPFVNGWGRTYNVLAAVGTVLLYAGCVFALSALKRRENALLLALILYGTAVFALTDATPRYLLPTIFCYVAFAAVGYERLAIMVRRSLS